MVQIYRETDPISGRWSGNSGGIDLSAFQIDQNFYEILQAIATIEANIGSTIGIAYITISGNELTFHMSNHTLQGPFAIPLATFLDRGAWAPLTAYSVNDTFNINGTLYLVIFSHTSAATFSAGANDGAGHNYYSAMLSLPGNSLPTGGAAGTMLKKSTGANFAVAWGYALPNGGTIGQALVKNSNTDQDVKWASFSVSAVNVSYSPIGGSILSGDINVETALDAISLIIANLPSTYLQTSNNLSEVNASIARTNLHLEFCTDADFWSNASDSGVLTPTEVWNSAQLQTLADASTILLNFSTFINATVTLGGNRTLDNPTNAKPGQSGFINVLQDATGGRTLAFGGNWKFAGGIAPSTSSAANARDILFYTVVSTGTILGVMVNGVS